MEGSFVAISTGLAIMHWILHFIHLQSLSKRSNLSRYDPYWIVLTCLQWEYLCLQNELSPLIAFKRYPSRTYYSGQWQLAMHIGT